MTPSSRRHRLALAVLSGTIFFGGRGFGGPPDVPLGAGVMGAGYVAPASSGEAPFGTCPPGATVEGLDVSYYQSTVDWAQVKSAGREFAFIRVSDGATFFDPQFNANWANSKAAGVIRGAYQFFRPAQDAMTQADFLLTHMGALSAGDLPPVLDVEVTGSQTNAVIAAGIQTWVTRVQSVTGLTPIIYTSPGFWSSIGSPDFSSDTLWVAHWGAMCPTVPSHWSNWKFWQYSSTGDVAGLNPVDLDKWNGSLSELVAFTGCGSADAAGPAVTAPTDLSLPQSVCQ